MLIFDKRRPARAGNTNIRPPKGGRIKTAPPASGPRLGRSSAWGVPPPGPLGCAPCGLTATGTRCLPTSREGQAQRAGPQARRVSGLFGGIFLKAGPCGCAAGGSGGRAPRCSGAVGNACAGGGRPGVNAQRCPRRPRAAALSTAERATGRSGRGCWPAAGVPTCARDHRRGKERTPMKSRTYAGGSRTSYAVG